MSKVDPLEELRKQYHDLASLAGSLAHEIKNPLSIILMNVELLEEDFEESADPSTRRALQRVTTVKGQCERMETILNDFLRFTRLSSLELQKTHLLFSPVIMEAHQQQG